MRVSTIQSEPKKELEQVYISETGDYYRKGEILKEYDLHENFLGYVKINKFIKHKKYLSVNIQSMQYKTKNWSLNVKYLGTLYRK